MASSEDDVDSELVSAADAESSVDASLPHATATSASANNMATIRIKLRCIGAPLMAAATVPRLLCETDSNGNMGHGTAV